MLQDKMETAKEFWNEYKKVKYGVVGLIFIIIFILIVLFEAIISPFPNAGKNWRNIEYWQENPKSARPIWVNYITAQKYPKNEIIHEYDLEKKESKRALIRKMKFEYINKYEKTPSDITLRYMAKGKGFAIVSVMRPDGKKIKLAKQNFDTDNLEKKEISISNEGKQGAYKFLRENIKIKSNVNQDMVDSIDVIFKNFETDQILKGNYEFFLETVLIRQNKEGLEVKNFSLNIVGRVFGLMGTDSFKRDIFSGLIAGMKWALLIGFLVSLATVSIGVVYGVISAYFGGMIDSTMQRIYEYFVNIPFLPILIVISAVFKPSIWTFIGLMCLLGWTGSVRTVRSIGLQIREETFVEASKALGASHTRIIFFHMIPLLIPYAFASMALAVPSAILAEAGISILGLGDSTIVTWGQMLQDAKTAGAVIQGMWWWVLPPGIMITLVGMSFAFIGFSMDKILMPKLKMR